MMNKKLINILAVSFVALFITQVGHEAAHGIIASLLGAKWTEFNLFYVEHEWPGEMNVTGEILIKGSAAILNVLLGLLAVYLFNRRQAASDLVRTTLPDILEPVWVTAAALLLAIAAFVLLPSLNFS